MEVVVVVVVDQAHVLEMRRGLREERRSTSSDHGRRERFGPPIRHGCSANLHSAIGASLAATATAMKELLASNTLLRGPIDALQVEVNQLRSEIADCQDSRVPAEIALQECSGLVEAFQQWILMDFH